MEAQKQNKCCGDCSYHINQGIDGWGYCIVKDKLMHCGERCNDLKKNAYDTAGNK